MSRRRKGFFASHKEEPELKTPRFPVQQDHVITLDYTLTDENGTLLDTTMERGVFAYLHGSPMLPACFQETLEGHYAGDKVSAHYTSEQAFGEHEPSCLKEYELPLFTGVDELKVGMCFEMPTSQGPKFVTVVEVDDNQITVDENHPLAGKNMDFNCTIVSVRPATEEEVENGKVIT